MSTPSSRKHHPSLLDDVGLGLNLGYDGVQKDYSQLNAGCILRAESPDEAKEAFKAKEPTSKQKRFTQKLSKESIVVEHAISELKIQNNSA